MNTYDAMTKADDIACDISQARTVLDAALEHFDFADEKHLSELPHYAGKIRDLLYVTDKLLFDIQTELEKTACALEVVVLQERGEQNGQT